MCDAAVRHGSLLGAMLMANLRLCGALDLSVAEKYIVREELGTALSSGVPFYRAELNTAHRTNVQCRG